MGQIFMGEHNRLAGAPVEQNVPTAASCWPGRPAIAAYSAPTEPCRARSKISQVRVVSSGPRPRAAVGEPTVDDDGRQDANAVTPGRHRDGGIVHVANFDIVLSGHRACPATSRCRRWFCLPTCETCAE